MRRMNEAILNPGRTWRSGCATEVFGPSPQHPYYPDGVAGSQIAPSANSKRQKTEQDTVKGGELYNSPVDPSAPSLTQAIEEPGVFAGFSAKHNLPDITGSWGSTKGYVWCPLRERVDLDYVHRQIAMSGLFENVRPRGSGGGPFKKTPWNHMTPYKSAFEWKGPRFLLRHHR